MPGPQVYVAVVDPNSGVLQEYVTLVDSSGNLIYQSAAPPQGRLTLTTAVPVLSGTVAAATSVIYTPYIGNVIPLWNSSYNRFIPTTFTELSNVLANSSTGNAGPAAAAANENYDLFVWRSGTTNFLTRGPVWTNATTRSAGTALAMVQGILVNNVAITNGPAAQAGTYVGTVHTDAGGATVTWDRGSAAAGGGAASLYVWNMYNRVRTFARVSASDASWTYNSATIRAANASATMRISFVRGLADDAITAQYYCHLTTAATATSFGQIGIGLDVTNNFSSKIGRATAPTAAVFANVASAEYINTPAIGFHFLSGNESTDTSTVTFTANSILLQALTADLWF